MPYYRYIDRSTLQNGLKHGHPAIQRPAALIPAILDRYGWNQPGGPDIYEVYSKVRRPIPNAVAYCSKGIETQLPKFDILILD